MYEMSCQSRFDARYWMLGAGALGQPRGMVWGGRREEGSGWGIHVHPWQIHVDVWQNQYNIVKLKKIKKINKFSCVTFQWEVYIISTYFFMFFSIMVYHRILNIVLCALPVGPCFIYLFIFLILFYF